MAVGCVDSNAGADNGIVTFRVTACRGKLHLERPVEVDCARFGVEVWFVMVHRPSVVLLVGSLTSGQDFGQRRSPAVDKVPSRVNGNSILESPGQGGGAELECQRRLA